MKEYSVIVGHFEFNMFAHTPLTHAYQQNFSLASNLCNIYSVAAKRKAINRPDGRRPSSRKKTGGVSKYIIYITIIDKSYPQSSCSLTYTSIDTRLSVIRSILFDMQAFDVDCVDVLICWQSQHIFPQNRKCKRM